MTTLYLLSFSDRKDKTLHEINHTMPTRCLIKGGGGYLRDNTTQPNQTLHQSFLHHAGMDKRQKKQWDKMTKQWDEIRELARAAGERDDQARATAARVRQEALARMAAFRNEAKAKEAPRSSNPIPDVPTERSGRGCCYGGRYCR